MGYVTRFTSHAQRDLLKVPRPHAIGSPNSRGHGHASRRRLRVGDYRVVYTAEDGRLIIWVLAAGHRREVYRDR
ncbi:type II toxin-antitoxin system RelE/ParE family toxin [Streptomyces sp. NPDC059874]|uniref:type II toxin-antitoxin system RelE family toxin n=1 Tax=Streptomyces sp. NPDC059874 TaxID=3346983 RepID=UPI00365A0DDD